jgi:hypothetical protein
VVESNTSSFWGIWFYHGRIHAERVDPEELPIVLFGADFMLNDLKSEVEVLSHFNSDSID